MSEKKPFNKKKVIGITGTVAVCLAAVGLWWWYTSSGIVSTDDARVKGTIVAVSSRVSARVDEIMVNEGDTVQAGQVIAKLDSKELEAQVAQAKANLTAAQAKLAGLKAGNRPQQIAQADAVANQAAANLDEAQKAYERAEALFNEGAVAQQQLDAAKTALSVAQAQHTAANQSLSMTQEGTRAEDIQVAQAQVEQAEAALKTMQLQLDNTVITAPVSGTVAVRSVDKGENVSVNQPLFNIADLKDVWVAANIDETQFGKLQVGQLVDFTIDAYPGQKFIGEILEVGAATGSQFSLLPTENTSGNYTKVTQKLPVKVKSANIAAEILKPGMSAVINVHVR